MYFTVNQCYNLFLEGGYDKGSSCFLHMLFKQ